MGKKKQGRRLFGLASNFKVLKRMEEEEMAVRKERKAAGGSADSA
jgi:hypothetical protein